ncbi:MAG: hypothetical protein PVF21_03730 [Thiohalophilus sp.]|jgi:hypothetical protein
MQIQQLLDKWAGTARHEEPVIHTSIELPLEQAARLLALQDMYPGRTREQLLLDLISTALDELEAALPYVPGNKVVSEDEYGDPIYEDVGPTPRFLELTRKYRDQIQQESTGKSHS